MLDKIGKVLSIILWTFVLLAITILAGVDGQGMLLLIPIGFGLLAITLLPLRFLINRFNRKT